MTNRAKKVLIIDDDDDFAESIGTFLELHGHRVLRATDGDQGVSMAAVERPDMILCDVMMKERTEGFFTVQRLRRTAGIENTPILIISSIYSAVPAFQVEPDSSWLAHDEFLPKPVDPDELLKRIEAAP